MTTREGKDEFLEYLREKIECDGWRYHPESRPAVEAALREVALEYGKRKAVVAENATTDSQPISKDLVDRVVGLVCAGVHEYVGAARQDADRIWKDTIERLEAQQKQMYKMQVRLAALEQKERE